MLFNPTTPQQQTKIHREHSYLFNVWCIKVNARVTQW